MTEVPNQAKKTATQKTVDYKGYNWKNLNRSYMGKCQDTIVLVIWEHIIIGRQVQQGIPEGRALMMIQSFLLVLIWYVEQRGACIFAELRYE